MVEDKNYVKLINKLQKKLVRGVFTTSNLVTQTLNGEREKTNAVPWIGQPWS
jgi:hypothetical protein